MILMQALKMAWKSMISNKLRSFLTILGMIIGVFSVIALVSLGKGLGNNIQDQMGDMGILKLYVNITGRGTNASLSVEDTMALKKKENVAAISPTISGSVKAKSGNKNKEVPIEGVVPDYETVENFHVQKGRFIVQADVNNRTKVALIGTETATNLFGLADPMGKEVILNGIAFRIVGVLESKGTSFMGSQDNKLMIPISTAGRLLANPGINSFVVKVNAAENIDGVMASLRKDLLKRFKTPTGDGFHIYNQQEFLEQNESMMATMTAVLGGIAGISLLVGGIGIMNIMLVSVSERTREIGVRKALGAKKRDILLQFLIESVLLGATGGLIGVVIGIGIALGLGQAFNLRVPISLGVISFAFSFSLVIGVVFGLFPANKAAKLRPIDALRVD
ncbi:ABC transporter permease [Paenibacillus sp. N1-5-1-14]|uniref:ABC transporter permease n=1 Tax=Paenibacillus radicibacter TaxID=2972488 RepID=UPI0021598CF2|nr:ABC transporter permease [Paenibacillus radicibacter]MCR8643992.1 ABC transporter permease [Paenibacillus radicibacter]